MWGDRVLVSQPLDKEQRRTLMCFDRHDGKLLWQSGVKFSDKEPTHELNPYCSPSPVTDGQRIVVWYGSAGLYCYDFKGRELWHRELGPVTHIWGVGSSPVLVGELCILNFGPGDPSFVIAVNKKTGETVWKRDVPHARTSDGPSGVGENGDAAGPELYGSWATPLLIEAGDRQELILALPEEIVSCDPPTGRELWKCRGLGDLVYASPLWGDGVVVGLGGYYGPSIAVKPGDEGDVTKTRLWQTPHSKLLLGTGVIYQQHIFVADVRGIASCLDLQTGKSLWSERLKGNAAKSDSWSSMVLSGDKIYLPNKAGDVFVFKAGPKFELLATNSVDETTNSTLAVSNGEIFLRTHDGLWCFGASK